MLVIIRGLPGSGKSTIAKTQFPNFVNYEADMFFTDNSGNYAFDKTRLQEAHSWCIEATRKALSERKDVVVSNTFTRLYEIQPYVKMAMEFNIPLQIVHATGNYKNTHNVPEEFIDIMKSRWENIPTGTYTPERLYLLAYNPSYINYPKKPDSL